MKDGWKKGNEDSEVYETKNDASLYPGLGHSLPHFLGIVTKKAGGVVQANTRLSQTMSREHWS